MKLCTRCRGTRWILRQETPAYCPKCNGAGVLKGSPGRSKKAETHFEELDPRDFALTRADILRARA